MSDATAPVPDPAPTLPQAEVEPAGGRGWVWILPVLSLALAVFLAFQAWGDRGPLIRVHAREGHGLQAGAALRHRGIDVGRVEHVLLAEDLEGVELTVRLDRAAARLARAGSRFWIVRPVLSLDTVAGLETVVGARYLAVDPGPVGGARQREFEALERPPVPERLEPGALLVTLESPTRYGLAPGAPLTHRDIQIGVVRSVELARDASAVEIGVYVEPGYVQLVREHSVFWETGGIELDVSLTGGLDLDVGTLRSLVVGGVAVATPPESGEPVATGHRFPLAADPEPAWLRWSPPLPAGAAGLPEGAREPLPRLASLSWRKSGLFRGRRERAGWVLPVVGGLLGPADLLTPDGGAREGSSVLEVEGASFALESPPTREALGVALVPLALPDVERLDLEVAARALPPEPEECLVYGDPGASPLALAARRLEASPRGWEVDGAVGLDRSWNGACVVSLADGLLLGLLLVDGDGARVAPVREGQ